MKDLEIKDIAGYFPYNLRFINLNRNMPYHINGISINYEIEYVDENNYHTHEYLAFCKPILRPMSDLTKPIKIEGYNNGEEFVPLIEMAKIAAGCLNKEGSSWEIYEKYELVAQNKITNSNEKFLFYLEWRLTGGFKLTFESIEVDNNGDILSPLREYDFNLMPLLELLYQWHFDIHELIDQGLAIDINTITK